MDLASQRGKIPQKSYQNAKSQNAVSTSAKMQKLVEKDMAVSKFSKNVYQSIKIAEHGNHAQRWEAPSQQYNSRFTVCLEYATNNSASVSANRGYKGINAHKNVL